MKLVVATGNDPATFRLLDDDLAEVAKTAWQRLEVDREAVAILDRFLSEQGASLVGISTIYVQTEVENGSFTGLRLGVSLVMGLGYALGVPTIPFAGGWDADKARALPAVSPQKLRPLYKSPPKISHSSKLVIP